MHFCRTNQIHPDRQLQKSLQALKGNAPARNLTISLYFMVPSGDTETLADLAPADHEIKYIFAEHRGQVSNGQKESLGLHGTSEHRGQRLYLRCQIMCY